MAMSCSMRPGESKIFGVPPKCSFCGESRTAGLWQAPKQVIGCCRRCATSVLPALAADCLVDTGIPTIQELKAFEDRLSAGLSRGVAHASSLYAKLFMVMKK